jgi:hypothetical protein
VSCADRIAERRVARVVIGMLDPNDAITGLGELRLREARIEILRFDPDLMSEIEELNREFIRLHATGTKRRRPYAEMGDPVEPDQTGPNGYRIGFTDEGDKVEWVPSEENPAEEWPLLLRRTTVRSSTRTTNSGTRCGGTGTGIGSLALNPEMKRSLRAKKPFSNARGQRPDVSRRNMAWRI